MEEFMRPPQTFMSFAQHNDQAMSPPRFCWQAYSFVLNPGLANCAQYPIHVEFAGRSFDVSIIWYVGSKRF